MSTSKFYKEIKDKETRILLKNRDLYRDITHSEYIFYKDKKNFFCRKELSEYPQNLRGLYCKKKFSNDEQYYERYRIDDKYWEVYPIYASNTYLFIFLSFFVFSVFLLSRESKFEFSDFMFLLIISLIFMYSLVKKVVELNYKQEQIYDRLNGTLTFPGVFWGSNITMSFNTVKFSKVYYGNRLNITGVNPKFFGQSFHIRMNHFSIPGMKYYRPDEGLTLLTWYMDKNRPLPQIKDFESYREKDFERRKAEGFPPPLYSSFFNTPEDTPEQQKEREKYWKERIFHDDEGSLITEIIRGDNEIFDMKTRLWVTRQDGIHPNKR